MIANGSLDAGKRVSLMINTYAGEASGILEGVGGYLSARRNWIVQRRDTSEKSLERIEAFAPDGILASVRDQAMGERLLAIGVPVVNVRGNHDLESIPRVTFNEAEAGALQAAHLMESGYRNLLFVGFFGRYPTRKMYEGALNAARRASVKLDHLQFEDLYATAPYGKWPSLLAESLRGRDLPLGVLTATCEDAERVAQRCHELKLEIPEEVAIVSLNEDAISASLAYPKVSTVDVAWKRLGMDAAEYLDHWMSHTRGGVPGLPPPLPPQGLTRRRSTDHIAVGDPQVARAVAYIRGRAHERIAVDEVARASGLSRRLLEMRFAKTLGRSPFEEIRRHQVDVVRALLLETELSLDEVCARTAFSNTSHMSLSFKQSFGCSPGQFRRKFR